MMPYRFLYLLAFIFFASLAATAVADSAVVFYEDFEAFSGPNVDVILNAASAGNDGFTTYTLGGSLQVYGNQFMTSSDVAPTSGGNLCLQVRMNVQTGGDVNGSTDLGVTAIGKFTIHPGTEKMTITYLAEQPLFGGAVFSNNVYFRGYSATNQDLWNDRMYSDGGQIHWRSQSAGGYSQLLEVPAITGWVQRKIVITRTGTTGPGTIETWANGTLLGTQTTYGFTTDEVTSVFPTSLQLTRWLSQSSPPTSGLNALYDNIKVEIDYHQLPTATKSWTWY
jgi:hypothetical protein